MADPEATDESLFALLIVVAILCAILMILTVAVCCYICARRYWIKKSSDVYDPRFVAGHLWHTDNKANGVSGVSGMNGGRQLVSQTPVGGPHSIYNPGPITKSSVAMVGCPPGGKCGGAGGGACCGGNSGKCRCG